VAVDGNHAYLAENPDGLCVVDISDPTQPSLVGSYASPGNALGVARSGGYSYLADEIAGLAILGSAEITDRVYLPMVVRAW
jgi:hypothetical protein